MSFLMPKPKKPPPPPNTPITANAAEDAAGMIDNTSLISTAAQGLRRKASTQRTSLIGGAQ